MAHRMGQQIRTGYKALRKQIKFKMEQLPPGFRFYPTEEELITFYLQCKLHGQRPELDRVIPSIDIYNFEPSQLPGLAGELCHGEREQWFFFMAQQEREARGGRPNRTTASGYWKATGSPGYVYSSNNRVIGVKKTMVFYKGKAPSGRKTKWKMNEYKAINQDDDIIDTNASSSTTIPKLRHELSLCRVYVTSGSARAFDRRPPGTMLNMINTQNASHNEYQLGQGIGKITQNVNNSSTMLMEDKSSSTESSNSGGADDNNAPLQEVAAGSVNCHDIEMAEDLESLWDWEQLNWL